MLRWAFMFAVIAVVASILGFSGVAGESSNIAWMFALVFLVVAVVSALTGRKVGGPTV